ncbi:MAG: outer membrane protein [Limisphaerales bacterium]|jgi:outer membrane protein
MKLLSLYISLLFTSFSMLGQEALTLEKAIALGLENNYQIKIDDRFIEIAENNDNWAIAGGAPTVNLRGNLGNDLVNNNNPASFLQGTFYSGSLSGTLEANWVLLNGGRVRIAQEQLSLATDQQRLTKNTDINTLIKDIIQDYHEVLLQQERLSVFQESLNLSKSLLQNETQKKAFGNSSTYNLIQFENNIISDSINTITQQLQIEVAKRNLFTTINIFEDSEYLFADGFSTVSEIGDLATLQSTLLNQNPNLVSLDLLKSISALNTKLEKAAWKPTISLSASGAAARNAFQFYEDDPTTGEQFDLIWSNQYSGSLGATFNWSLVDGGIRKTNIENARVQEEIDRLNYEEARIQLQNQLVILLKNYENQQQLVDLTGIQLALASQNLTLTEDRFDTGIINSLDLRTVQNQYLNSELNKINAIYNLIITKSEIDALIGNFN